MFTLEDLEDKNVKNYAFQNHIGNYFNFLNKVVEKVLIKKKLKNDGLDVLYIPLWYHFSKAYNIEK